MRPFEEEHLSFKKSHSYDPFPVASDHHHHHYHHHQQLNKKNNENFRKRKNNTSEPLKEVGCNGGVTSQTQRSDHEPLLEPKRWHSLELETVRTNREEESSGCEERNGTNKKYSRIKSWLVGILKSKSPNGQNELLSQQTSITKTRNVDSESMSVV